MQAKACLLIAPSLMCKGSLLYHPGGGVGWATLSMFNGFILQATLFQSPLKFSEEMRLSELSPGIFEFSIHLMVFGADGHGRNFAPDWHKMFEKEVRYVSMFLY